MMPTNRAWKVMVPWLLVWFRGYCAPILIWASILIGRNWLVGAVVIAAFLSDWIDGVLARRWQTSTPELRRADSLADTLFYLNVLAAGLFSCHTQLWPLVPWFAGLLGLEILCQTTNYIRFGCRTSTHAYLCKAWAVALCIASAEMFISQSVGWAMWISILLGYIAYVDVLGIICILPIPAVDVPSSLHARRLRAHSTTTTH